MKSPLLLLVCLVACGHKKEVVKPMAEVPLSHSERFNEVVARFPRFLDRGFVVSINQGDFAHQGDSLLFSGLSLYALSCKDGQPIADAFVKMLTDLDGGAYRHPDLATQEVSLDGLLGMYRGIAKRVLFCGEKDLWAPLMRNHRARMAAELPAEFSYIPEVLSSVLGLNDMPDARRRDTLAAEISTWAALVKASKSACYRIHLGLIGLQTLDFLGSGISDKQRGDFAEATNGTGMPTTEHFSGRSGLGEFLDGFEYNKWEYNFQRCEKWESPDGAGMDHPAVDYLVGYADLYGSPK